MNKKGDYKFFKAKNVIAVLFILVLMFFIYNFGGHLFNFENTGETGDIDSKADETGLEETVPEKREEAVKHISKTEYLNTAGGSPGIRQMVNLLEVDVSVPGTVMKPVLSFDLIYGFELLSDMVSRKGAYAGVNGGFFTEYGFPSGMVVIDGDLLTASTGKYPVLVITGGKAEIVEIKSELHIEYKSGDGREGTIAAVGLNTDREQEGIVVYTPVYGKNNRVKADNITAVVKNGMVDSIGVFSGEVPIPRDGMLITFLSRGGYDLNNIPLKVSDRVTLRHNPDFIKPDTQAYECGSWLVRDGVAVAGDWDQWIGVLTNRDPRTAVGITEDDKVVLVTVDGRQPGYSEGMTGKELAGYLISIGLKDAAMLDGGASTEMILNGEIVNRPSFKGTERPLGGGLLVFTGDGG